MRKKGKKAALMSVVIAGVLAIALFTAGTLLRMNTHEMGFAEAFCSFASDTFSMNAPHVEN